MASHFYGKLAKSIDIFSGYPDFTESSPVIKESKEVRSSTYSPCGRYLVYTQPEAVHIVNTADWSAALDLPLKDVYDLEFSPKGSYITTWERPSKTNGTDEPDYKNVKVYRIADGELLVSYTAKSQSAWRLQWAATEEHVLRNWGAHELRLYQVAPGLSFDKPWAYLKQQNLGSFSLSPGANPTIATFVPEKAGKPAVFSVYPVLAGEISKPIVSKTFFKADTCQMKWNNAGSAVLGLATTDFDQSNQSYYGETTLYLLTFSGVNGAAGGDSLRVPLDKEGPIHDFEWSPTARQFGVVYGFMPAKTTFFDLRANVVHSLPESPRNTLSFSPTGRYILVAGFGNLQGSVDILDRHDKFKCVTKFEAANTSVCKWSPGGEFIMTATTAPRLRVDNGIKVWHISGELVFAKEYQELLKVDWNPSLLEGAELAKLDPRLAKKQLQVHASVAEYNIKHPKKTATVATQQKAGAYRPPHARRAGEARSVPGMAPKSVPGMAPKGVPGMAPKKTVPGAAVPESKAAAKNRKKREAKKAEPEAKQEIKQEAKAAPVENKDISPEEKKIRSLLKKLRAIEALKLRQAAGDKLEDTQVQKIQTEDKVVKELESLGWNGEQ